MCGQKEPVKLRTAQCSNLCCGEMRPHDHGHGLCREELVPRHEAMFLGPCTFRSFCPCVGKVLQKHAHTDQKISHGKSLFPVFFPKHNKKPYKGASVSDAS
jgi:hypothetical protein